MANASYFADTAIKRLDVEVGNRVERVAAARKNITASDIASLSSMDYSFRLDLSATKAAVKSMTITQSYLSTAITSLENASAILAKIHELAVLGANGSNSDADNAAIDNTAEALADEFHKAMSTSEFKGTPVFDEINEGAQISSGNRSSTPLHLGISKLDYDFFYDHTNPGLTSLNSGVNYEVKRSLSTVEKDAILSRTTGLTADQLVPGFQFLTDEIPAENTGEGSISVNPDNINTLSYTKNDPATQIDEFASAEIEGDFKGGYLDIKVANNYENGDQLSLQSFGKITVTDGVVFFQDDNVINGPKTIEIGSIDATKNGENGKTLRINLHADATVPGTSTIENGNFQKDPPTRDQGLPPTETYTLGEHRTGIAETYAVVIDPENDFGLGGTGYTQADDTDFTDLERGSDTYSLSFLGGSGTGFRAHVNVKDDGSVEIVEVLDKGRGYTLGDILRLDNATELGGAGNGFAIEITEIVNSLGDGNGTIGVEVASTPDFDPIEVMELNVGNDRYAWGESYVDGSVKRVEVEEDAIGAVETNYIHEEASSYDWEGLFDGDGIALTNFDNSYDIDDVVLEKLTIAEFEANPKNTDIPIYSVDADGNVLFDIISTDGYVEVAGDREITDGTINITEAEHLASSHPSDTAIYERDADTNAIIFDVLTEDERDASALGPLARDRAIVDTAIVSIEDVENGADYDRAVATTNESDGQYAWGETYLAGSDKKILGDGGGTSEVKHTEDGVYTWDLNGADYDLNYFDGDTVLTYVADGDNVDGDTAVMKAGGEAGVGVAFYTRINTVNTTLEISHYEKDTTTYERDRITHYERDNVTGYERDTIAFYARESTLYTAEVNTGNVIQKYVGETYSTDQAHTGWTQDFEQYIQNWTTFNERINFGENFTILDSLNGERVTSSTETGEYEDASYSIEVPTPSLADMALPAYEDYYDEAAAEWNISDPALEGRDDAAIVEVVQDGVNVSFNPIDNALNPTVDLVANDTGMAVELSTGSLRFQDSGTEFGGFGIYHGPAIVSDVFDANEGQFLKLDYTALGEDDDYHVAGYIYRVEVEGAGDTRTERIVGDPILALNRTGSSADTRASVEVPETGEYRFVFIVGTHDLTGGYIAGANMTIDNIVAEDPYEISDAAIDALLKAVYYENNAETAVQTKTLLTTLGNEDESVVLNDESLINMLGFETTDETLGPYMIAPTDNLVHSPSDGASNNPNILTAKIEVLQEQINAARGRAASQYAALENAIESTTDLRSQFALASGTLSDLNFSEETAYLTKKQIQHDIATSMLAQANQNQANLLMLIS